MMQSQASLGTMNNDYDRINSTLVENCLQVLPDEYFIMSLSVIGILTVLFLLLFLTTVLMALEAKRSLLRRERTWITALDFIGGIGGVDSIFESYDTFLGKNRSQLEELRRQNSESRRRFSSPFLRKDHLLWKKISDNKRSNSNFETARRRRTLKKAEEDEANFCIEILHNPSKYYQNLEAQQQVRLSMSSLSAETVHGWQSAPSTPVKSPEVLRKCSSMSTPLCPTPALRRKFIKFRSASVDALQTAGQTDRVTTKARKKHSVIHEVLE